MYESIDILPILKEGVLRILWINNRIVRLGEIGLEAEKDAFIDLKLIDLKEKNTIKLRF